MAKKKTQRREESLGEAEGKKGEREQDPPRRAAGGGVDLPPARRDRGIEAHDARWPRTRGTQRANRADAKRPQASGLSGVKASARGDAVDRGDRTVVGEGSRRSRATGTRDFSGSGSEIGRAHV